VREVVTGSAGHLGEALARVLRDGGHDVTGVDLKPSPYTTVTGSVTDRAIVRDCVAGADAVLHTATLHKPHVGSHGKQAFVDTNVTGRLTLLEAAAAVGVRGFVFTSSTSAFGRALTPAPGDPAAWITEEVAAWPWNIYGVTKTAAEDLCELAHAELGLPVIVLRTSRFFPEGDDSDEVRTAYPRREREGQRVPVPAGRRGGRGGRAPAGDGARGGHRVRQVHRQRDHAVHPG
jgi:nucleoside-diphosphate-sugar epimerase